MASPNPAAGPGNTDHRLALRGVTRHYPGGDGVTNISLAVAPGEIHAVVGLNGAGKTTILRLALGMLRPDDGQVSLGGQPIATLDTAGWKHVGHLVEQPLVYPELSTWTNLTIGLRIRGIPKPTLHEAAKEAMTALDIAHYAETRARTLSAGNRWRLGLAIALAHQPRLVVLDEPTNSLDPVGVVHLRQLLVTLARQGSGVLVSSHHLDEVARIANRITVINDGRIVGTLDPQTPDIERAFFALILADTERHRA